MVSSDQPGGSYGSKDGYIESLLQQLHEKDSIISELKKKDQPPSSSQEDGSIEVAEAVLQKTLNEEIDEEAKETAGKDVGASTQSSHRASHGLSLRGSTVTWGDFLQGAKQMHAKNKQLVSKQAWYSPPAQRIRWGGDQSLQHVDWGDLFFDLFYVSAVYNLGVLGLSGFATGEHLRSAIYFLGSLGPLLSCWQFHTYYQARYAANDLFHRVVKILVFICIGFAIANIVPLDTYSAYETDTVMFFTLGILLESIISIGQLLELYYRATGDKDCIKAHTMIDIKFRMGPTFVVYVAAFVIAVVNHFAAFEQAEGEGEGSSATSEVSGSGTDNAAGAAPHRLLASKGSDIPRVARPVWDNNDIPLTLTAIVYILALVSLIPRTYWLSTRRNIKSWFVPFNIDYVIHRNGELTMLVIGEGILSLLISPTVKGRSYLGEYYAVLIMGILTMILIQVVNFETLPSDSCHHALYASRFQSSSFSLFFNCLTMSLIGFGVTYKGFLHGIYEEHLEQTEKDFTPASKTYSTFLFLVVFFLEMINVTHIGGFKKAYERQFVVKDGERKPHWPVILITLLKVGILLFSATLSQWTHEPDALAGCGCAAIFAVFITRLLIKHFMDQAQVEAGNAGDN